MKHQVAEFRVLFQDRILAYQFATQVIGLNDILCCDACGHVFDNRVEIFSLLDVTNDPLLVFFDTFNPEFVLGTFLGTDETWVAYQLHLLVHQGDEIFSIIDSGGVVGLGDELFGELKQIVSDIDTLDCDSGFVCDLRQFFLRGFQTHGWVRVLFGCFSNLRQGRFHARGACVFVVREGFCEQVIGFDGTIVVTIAVIGFCILPSFFCGAFREPDVEWDEEGQEQQHKEPHADNPEGLPRAFFWFRGNLSRLSNCDFTQFIRTIARIKRVGRLRTFLLGFGACLLDCFHDFDNFSYWVFDDFDDFLNFWLIGRK